MNIDEYFKLDFLKDLYQTKIKKSKSKGIDKVSVQDFEKKLDENLNIIIRKVLNGTYTFSPYLEILKLKGRNKFPRMISIPTIRDKMVLLIIKEILHSLFNESVNRKLPNNYIKDVKKYISNNQGEKFYLKLDLEKFYDTINHEILLKKLKDQKVPVAIVSLIEKAITNITVPQNTKRNNYPNFKCDIGVPQGLSISNILAQIYLIEFDKVIQNRKYFYQRYVDDILLINSYKISNYRVKNFIEELKKIKLSVNETKTEQNSLNIKPFTFLSYSIHSDKISVSEKNIDTFIKRIAAKITWFKDGFRNKEKRPEYLKNNIEQFKIVFIEELNDMITGLTANNKNYGWLFYFSEISDIDLLFKLDKIITNFFLSLQMFDNKRPTNLKKLVRSYYAIVYKQKNYISNYDNLDTIRKKRNFLVFRGQISSTKDYTNEEIENQFEKYQNKQINKIEQGLGYTYFN
ncbi:reverse transcriptase domain-containing protein [Chryseobacterium lineare]